MIQNFTLRSFSTRAIMILLFFLFTTTPSWADVKISGIAPKYYVDENTANGTVIAQFTVIDKAIIDGAYEALSYTMTSDHGADLLNDLFEVNEVNNFGGVRTVEISVKNQEKLDYENTKYDLVKLHIANSSNDYEAAKFYIIINNLNEDFTLSDQAFTLPEKKTDGSDWEAGTKVGDVIIADPDDGAKHIYNGTYGPS